MKRRGFLQLTGRSIMAVLAATLPFGFARMMSPNVSADTRWRIRPPGALKNDDAFIAACIGCGLCGEVCPPKCIQFYTHEGGKKANTPYIDPAQKACILCDKCMEVCPTESLTVIPKKEIDMGIAQIDQSACYPWVDQGVCGACVVICPLGEKAIGFDFANFYKPVVHDGCVGCGLCVEVCPHPSLPIWIVERSEGTVAKHGAGKRHQWIQ